METTDSAYPIRFDIDYQEEPRNRLTSAFRLILAIPILAVIAAIGAAGSSSGDPTPFMCIAAGVLFLPSLMLIVARQKYPRWWFDFSVAYLGFHNRVNVPLVCRLFQQGQNIRLKPDALADSFAIYPWPRHMRQLNAQIDNVKR